jgi:hypothetical protein
MIAATTGGTIAGYIALPLLLLACIGFGFACATGLGGYDHALAVCGIVAAVLCVPIILGFWWWGMAFTTSSDYHAWNVKQGTVEQMSKRLIATENGMSERVVFKIDGQPYGVDDTRATLVKVGDTVSLRCKKDYEWGIPREAHGWACRWNGVAR